MWKLGGDGTTEYLLLEPGESVQGDDAREAVRLQLYDARHAFSFLRQHADVRFVRAIRQCGWRTLRLEGITVDNDRRLLELVATELASGRMAIASRARSIGSAGAEALSEVEPIDLDKLRRAKPRSWIEIELIDALGNPIRAERYDAVFPNKDDG